ncbi:hypothetical protein GW17_00011887 [Ensete ventricosum]|nr:hypothetical protein GW17_00011887 [Ensete ventricosum]RZS13714.1 hypothetical protein BHM03_00045331 [Ensete ventricosum]
MTESDPYHRHEETSTRTRATWTRSQPSNFVLIMRDVVTVMIPIANTLPQDFPVPTTHPLTNHQELMGPTK